jgi:MerR family transcriptional regulator/heat shock protein HspR
VRRRRMKDHDERATARSAADRAVYIISVAAELAGVHPQTLRIYEQKGLVRPYRTSGNTRRYSEADIDRLRRVQRLTQEGVNLAGVKRILAMEEELTVMRARIAQLEVRLARGSIPMPSSHPGMEIVPLASVFSPPWRGRRA